MINIVNEGQKAGLGHKCPIIKIDTLLTDYYFLYCQVPEVKYLHVPSLSLTKKPYTFNINVPADELGVVLLMDGEIVL